MDQSKSDWKNKPREPLTVENFMSFQGDKPDGGARMISYLSANNQYLTVLNRIEGMKSFTAMKKALTTFRKDRENFEREIWGTWDKDTQKFQGPKPDSSS